MVASGHDRANLSARHGSSDVQVGDAEGVLLDELAAGFDDVAHQAGEDLVGDVRLRDLDRSSERLAGSSVVSHSCSAFISPRPL